MLFKIYFDDNSVGFVEAETPGKAIIKAGQMKPETKTVRCFKADKVEITL